MELHQFYISPRMRLRIFMAWSSVLEGFEQPLDGAGWMSLGALSPAWEERDLGRMVCFALLWRRNGAVLVTVNNNMSTRGNVRQTKQNTLGLKLGAGAEGELQQAQESPQCGHSGKQDRIVILITSMRQTKVLNSFSYQELKGLKHFHSDTQKKIRKHRIAVCDHN